jgi:hypothetical protein
MLVNVWRGGPDKRVPVAAAELAMTDPFLPPYRNSLGKATGAPSLKRGAFAGSAFHVTGNK